MPTSVTQTLDGDVTLPNQSGAGTRMVVVGPTGLISNQAIPAGGGTVTNTNPLPVRRVILGNAGVDVRAALPIDGGLALPGNPASPAVAADSGRFAYVLEGAVDTPLGGANPLAMLSLTVAPGGSFMASGEFTGSDGLGNVFAGQWRLSCSRNAAGAVVFKSFVVTPSITDPAWALAALVATSPALGLVTLSLDTSAVIAAPAGQWCLSGTGCAQ